jgi:hypothetical protein
VDFNVAVVVLMVALQAVELCDVEVSQDRGCFGDDLSESALVEGVPLQLVVMLVLGDHFSGPDAAAVFGSRDAAV